MPRIARAIIPEYPHHVTQRGNFGVNIFTSDDDRQRYLAWIIEYAEKHGVRIWAYCLMTNHVHFIAVPAAPDSLARMFNKAHMRYSQYFNRRQGQRGHLWQNRFFSCVLDDAHLYHAVKYIETNPVRAGLVDRAELYVWSSAGAHIAVKQGTATYQEKGGLRTNNGSSENNISLIGRCTLFSDNLPHFPFLSSDLPLLESVENWPAYLQEATASAWAESFHKATLAGRPLGSDLFVKRVEAYVGRRLHAFPRGRPKAKPEAQ